MTVTACVVPAVVGVASRVAVDELRSLGLAAVFYQDFETLTGCPGFVWDGVNFLPSSCCVLDLV